MYRARNKARLVRRHLGRSRVASVAHGARTGLPHVSSTNAMGISSSGLLPSSCARPLAKALQSSDDKDSYEAVASTRVATTGFK